MKEKPKEKAGQSKSGKGQAKERGASGKPAKKKSPKKSPKKKTAKKDGAGSAARVKSSESEVEPAKPPKTRVGRKKPVDTGSTKLDPLEVAKRTMKGSMPAIVKTMVKLAKEGSCTHAKTLLEMTGAKHMFEGETETQANGEPWAKLVLERLDEADAAQESASGEPVEVAGGS